MKDVMKLKALIIFRAVWYKYDLWHPVQYVQKFEFATYQLASATLFYDFRYIIIFIQALKPVNHLFSISLNYLHN